jgi:hypothetical protein
VDAYSVQAEIILATLVLRDSLHGMLFGLTKFSGPDWETKYSVINHTKEFVYEYRT